MSILITGGSGYIGSHVTNVLLQRNERVAVLAQVGENLAPLLQQLKALTGKQPWIFRGDITNEALVNKVLRITKTHTVVHLAARKHSDGTPWQDKSCFDVNVGGLYNVIRSMNNTGAKKLVYVSQLPSEIPLEVMGAFDQSNHLCERMLRRFVDKSPGVSVACLRMALVGGTHCTGFLAEHETTANHSVFAYLGAVACREKPHAFIYPCRRDYLHISDAAQAIVASITKLATTRGLLELDIGTGVPTQTEHLLKMFEDVNQTHIPYGLLRCPAEVSQAQVADISMAEQQLGWRSTTPLERICRDQWMAYTIGANTSTPPPFSRIAACRSSI